MSSKNMKQIFESWNRFVEKESKSITEESTISEFVTGEEGAEAQAKVSKKQKRKQLIAQKARIQTRLNKKLTDVAGSGKTAMKSLQTMIAAAGFHKMMPKTFADGAEPDGVYGEETFAAIKALQRCMGIPKCPKKGPHGCQDGVIGPKTEKLLKRYIKGEFKAVSGCPKPLEGSGFKSNFGQPSAEEGNPVKAPAAAAPKQAPKQDKGVPAGYYDVGSII